MKKLKARARKLTRRITRNQKWLHRTSQLKRKLPKGLGRALERPIELLRKRLKSMHAELREVNQKMDELQQAADGGRAEFVKFLESVVGMTEDSKRRLEINDFMGGDASWPWCSELVGYGLIRHGGFKRAELPSNPFYSGAWLTWSLGERVSYSEAKPGDLLIFDWGDGGMTDHVATYIGSGIKIGGNENDRVERDAVPVSNIVGVIRPRWAH